MAAFTMLTLIGHGDGDALVPIEISGRRAARMIPDGERVVYEDASHWLFVAHRGRLDDQLTDFGHDRRSIPPRP
jgi:pimeloyl-ACP methyl ester carboxylesterase